MSAIEAVKAKAKEKRQQLESSASADSRDFKIIDIIEKLLRDPCCFLKIDIKTSAQMLMFLGYSKEEAVDLHIKLVYKAWIGEYTIVEPPGIIVKSEDWYGEE